MVQLVSPLRDGSELVNVNAVPSFGEATLTIVRNPLLGATTQSEGSELGSPEG